jgi:CRISPR-associated protein, Cas2 family
MLVWVLYDISDDGKRNRVAKRCKQAGLIRVQKSAFLGKLERNRFDELSELCKSEIDGEKDSLYLFPFCDEDFKKVKVHGQGFDRKLVSDDILQQFF